MSAAEITSESFQQSKCFGCSMSRRGFSPLGYSLVWTLQSDFLTKNQKCLNTRQNWAPVKEALSACLAPQMLGEPAGHPFAPPLGFLGLSHLTAASGSFSHVLGCWSGAGVTWRSFSCSMERSKFCLSTKVSRA